MAKSRKKQALEAKNKAQEKQFFRIVGIITVVLLVIMFAWYMS